MVQFVQLLQQRRTGGGLGRIVGRTGGNETRTRRIHKPKTIPIFMCWLFVLFFIIR